MPGSGRFQPPGDSKGRVRTSKEQRKIILAEFERSGVSGAQFARQSSRKRGTAIGDQFPDTNSDNLNAGDFELSHYE